MQQLIKDLRIPASFLPCEPTTATANQRNRMKLVLERPCS